MYICNYCEEIFDEPIEEKTTYESYYGVAGRFPDYHDCVIYRCPNCRDEDIEELSEEDYQDIMEE